MQVDAGRRYSCGEICSPVPSFIVEFSVPIVEYKNHTFPPPRVVSRRIPDFFCHMKNDQTGDRPRDARHVYANPFNPHVCPFLSIISYLLVTPPTSDSCLFPGANQYNRYNKYLQKLLEEKRDYIMTKYGVNVDDIGAHSARKGASTYMTSGCVNGPSQQAVNIRCGWKMQGVTDTYCRYEAAGDQLCGRVVSGLPLYSHRFGVLPPIFKLESQEEKDRLDRLVRTLFPDLPVELWPIVKHGIASLALREDWFRLSLAPTNSLFQSSIFWNEDYQYLKPKAVLEMGVGDNNLEVDEVRTERSNSATGIPSHIVLLASQRNVIKQLQEMVVNNNNLPGVVTTAIQSANQGPRDEFHAAMSSLTTFGEQLVTRLENLSIGGPRQADTVELQVVEQDEQREDQEQGQDPRYSVNLHYHNGRFIRIDPDFIFPKQCSLRDLFFRYYIPDRVMNIPPLRIIDTASVKHIRRGRQTLNDMKYLMKVLEREAMVKGLELNITTQEEASVLFENVKEAIYKYDTKSKRKETLKWATWVKKVRKGTMEELVDL